LAALHDYTRRYLVLADGCDLAIVEAYSGSQAASEYAKDHRAGWVTVRRLGADGLPDGKLESYAQPKGE